MTEQSNETTTRDLSVLLARSPIAHFHLSADERILFVNEACETVLGLPLVDATTLAWQDLVHPDDVRRVERSWRAAVADGVTYIGRLRLRHAPDRWLEARVVQADPTDLEAGFVGTAIDVTTEVAAHEALRQARDEADRGSQLKSAFLANISHEIRTPLNGVLGIAQLLADTDLDGRQRSYVETLEESGGNLRRLLDDVLDLCKVEAGELRVDNRPASLREVLRASVRLFTGRATAKGIDIQLQIADAVPARAIFDADRVRQIVDNLLSNAVKFTDNGHVGVAVTAGRPSGGSTAVEITVTDTGIGIADEARGRLFRPFGQADATTTRRFGGSGLGLSISKQLAALLGGDITFTSTEGAGTQFRFTLPLAVADHAPDDIAESAPSPADVEPRRVLLVEDNPVNQLVVQAMLTKLGHEVVVARNGAEAVDLVTSDDYAVVIMDCQMPVLDGYDATRAIRELPGRAAQVPIIALTASAMALDRERCLGAGMDAYLAKPIRATELATAVATHARSD